MEIYYQGMGDGRGWTHGTIKQVARKHLSEPFRQESDAHRDDTLARLLDVLADKGILSLDDLEHVLGHAVALSPVDEDGA